jgi:alkylhydroperoxidase/carboxymuconolactone decarboxylase family protein YurZ
VITPALVQLSAKGPPGLKSAPLLAARHETESPLCPSLYLINIRRALNVGCTPDQILEIIPQIAVYARLPAALKAVRTAASLLGEAREVTH